MSSGGCMQLLSKLLNIDLADLSPLSLELGHGDDEQAVLHAGGDAEGVDFLSLWLTLTLLLLLLVVVEDGRGRERDATLKHANAALGRGHGALEDVVAGAMDDAGDAQDAGLGVPVNADVLLLGAGQGNVQDVGGVGVEDVDGREEAVKTAGVVVVIVVILVAVHWLRLRLVGSPGVARSAGAVLSLGAVKALDVRAEVLEEGVAGQAVHQPREVEGRRGRAVEAGVRRRGRGRGRASTGAGRESARRTAVVVMVVVVRRRRRRASRLPPASAAAPRATATASAATTAKTTTAAPGAIVGSVVVVVGSNFIGIRHLFGASSSSGGGGGVVVHHRIGRRFGGSLVLVVIVGGSSSGGGVVVGGPWIRSVPMGWPVAAAAATTTPVVIAVMLPRTAPVVKVGTAPGPGAGGMRPTRTAAGATGASSGPSAVSSKREAESLKGVRVAVVDAAAGLVAHGVEDVPEAAAAAAAAKGLAAGIVVVIIAVEITSHVGWGL
jgi:hypothetical protein